MNLHPNAVYVLWAKYFVKFCVPLLIIMIYFVMRTTFELSVLNIVIILFVLIVLAGLWAKLAYNAYSFNISKESLDIERGVLIKHSVSIPYERIQDVGIQRGIVARLAGVSEILVQTAGSSTPKRIFFEAEGLLPGIGIEAAEQLRDSIMKRVKGKGI